MEKETLDKLYPSRIPLPTKPQGELADDAAKAQMRNYAISYKGKHPNADHRAVERAVQRKFRIKIL